MTDFYTNGGPSNLGTLGISPPREVARIPSFLAEWAALIPLLCHLTSHHHQYQFVGEVALGDHINISLFPRLGVLKDIAQLLEEGPEFLDRASSTGGRRSEVWDVNWGSVFPCANGAASAMVAAYALRSAGQPIRIPDCVLPNVSQGDTHSAPVRNEAVETPSGNRNLGQRPSKTSLNKKTRLTIHKNVELSTLNSIPPSSDSTRDTGDSLLSQRSPAPFQEHFRRYQTLYIIKFGRTTVKTPRYHLPSYVLSTRCYQTLSSVFLGFTTVVLCIYGLYGTACAVLFGAASRIACLFLQIHRPPGFLENNELQSACMLVGIHQNTSVWYLYIGDRGVVDSLLNKTMVIIPTPSSVFLYFFKAFHVIQLLSMSFVAAEKGWDGISMVIFMVVAEVILWYSRKLRPAELWLKAEGITVEARSFEFTGRTSMVGAIQKFSGSKTTQWMDALVSPSRRRDVWLQRLGDVPMSERGWSYNQLGEFDKRWVDVNVTLATRAADLLQAQFSKATSL